MSKIILLRNVDDTMVVIKLRENSSLEIYEVEQKVRQRKKTKRLGSLVARISTNTFVELSFSNLNSLCDSQGVMSRYLYGEIKHWLLGNEYDKAVSGAVHTPLQYQVT